MSFEYEESYIGTKKAQFESLFKKVADDNLNEFLMYLNEKTNRTLISELEEFNKNFEELKESGILDNLNK
jgi:hypothetical protein